MSVPSASSATGDLFAICSILSQSNVFICEWDGIHHPTSRFNQTLLLIVSSLALGTEPTALRSFTCSGNGDPSLPSGGLCSITSIRSFRSIHSALRTHSGAVSILQVHNCGSTIFRHHVLSFLRFMFLLLD